MDEQSSDGQQPEIWESWTAPADPSSELDAGEAQQTTQPEQDRESGNPGGSSPAATSQLGWRKLADALADIAAGNPADLGDLGATERKVVDWISEHAAGAR